MVVRRRRTLRRRHARRASVFEVLEWRHAEHGMVGIVIMVQRWFVTTEDHVFLRAAIRARLLPRGIREIFVANDIARESLCSILKW